MAPSLRASRSAALLCLLALSGGGALLGAFQWPVESPVIRSTFGTIRDGRFEPGVQIAAEGVPVRAIQEGELLFSSDGASPFPAVLGSWLAVAHQEGLVSVYARLQPGSVAAERVKVETSTAIGMVGRSGDSQGPGLSLIVFDTVNDCWVNPARFLPPAPDASIPQVKSAWIKRDADAVPLGPSTRIKQGVVELLADVFDPDASGKGRNAPFSVRVLLAGSEKIGLSWDMMSAVDGTIRLFGRGGVTAADFGAQDGRLRLGQFPLPRGKMAVDIIVADYARNTRTVTYQVTAE